MHTKAGISQHQCAASCRGAHHLHFSICGAKVLFLRQTPKPENPLPSLQPTCLQMCQVVRKLGFRAVPCCLCCACGLQMTLHKSIGETRRRTNRDPARRQPPPSGKPGRLPKRLYTVKQRARAGNCSRCTCCVVWAAGVRCMDAHTRWAKLCNNRLPTLIDMHCVQTQATMKGQHGAACINWKGGGG